MAGIKKRKSPSGRSAASNVTDKRMVEAANRLPRGNKMDAHQLLTEVYQDDSAPLRLRIECAKTALAYERPRLSSQDVKVETRVEDMDEAQLEGYLKDLLSGEPEPPKPTVKEVKDTIKRVVSTRQH